MKKLLLFLIFILIVPVLQAHKRGLDLFDPEVEISNDNYWEGFKKATGIAYFSNIIRKATGLEVLPEELQADLIQVHSHLRRSKPYIIPENPSFYYRSWSTKNLNTAQVPTGEACSREILGYYFDQAIELKKTSLVAFMINSFLSYFGEYTPYYLKKLASLKESEECVDSVKKLLKYLVDTANKNIDFHKDPAGLCSKPLIYVVIKTDSLWLLQLLLENKDFNINCKYKESEMLGAHFKTPLATIFDVNKNFYSHMPKMVKMFIEKGADPNQRTYHEGWQGWGDKKNRDFIELLVRRAFDGDLEEAEHAEYAAIIKYLIRLKNVRIAGDVRSSLFRMSTDSKSILYNLETAEYLAQEDRELKYKLLLLAAQHNNIEMVKRYISFSPNDISDGVFKAALRGGSKELLELLESQGINTTSLEFNPIGSSLENTHFITEIINYYSEKNSSYIHYKDKEGNNFIFMIFLDSRTLTQCIESGTWSKLVKALVERGVSLRNPNKQDEHILGLVGNDEDGNFKMGNAGVLLPLLLSGYKLGKIGPILVHKAIRASSLEGIIALAYYQELNKLLGEVESNLLEGENERGLKPIQMVEAWLDMPSIRFDQENKLQLIREFLVKRSFTPSVYSNQQIAKTVQKVLDHAKGCPIFILFFRKALKDNQSFKDTVIKTQQ